MKGETKIVASIYIKDAGRMTKAGRKAVAKWLMRKAQDFLEIGYEYSNNFHTKYKCLK